MQRLLVFLFALLLTAPLAHAQNYFGAAVAATEGAAFAGASGGNRAPGGVYVYRPDSGSWVEENRLTAPEGFPGDGFGKALSASEGTLLVGAPAMADGQGRAYVFTRDDEGWSLAGEIAPPADTSIVGFGTAVAIDGDLAAIATGDLASGWAEPVEGAANTVHLYRRDASGTFQPAGVLDGDAYDAHASFGSALAVKDDLVLVGAPGSMREAVAVAVYPFRHTGQGNGWEPLQALRPDMDTEVYGYGQALAFDGEGSILVGAPMYGGTGAVLVYDTENFARERVVTPFDGAEGERFGRALAVTPNGLWVGAPGGYRSDTPGHVYIYRRDAETGELLDVTRDVAFEGGEGGDAFGSAVAATENVAIVGAPAGDHGAGTATLLLPGPDGRWVAESALFSTFEPLEPVVGQRLGCEDGEAAGFDCQGMELQSFLPISALGGERGVRLNDIWGWTDPQTGKEYALVGRIDGTSFVDVTDPTTPIYLGDLPKTEEANAASWRDIKVYDDHAFVVADGAGYHGMQVFDLTRLRAFDGTPQTFEPDAWYGDVYSVHNVVINEDTGFAYLVGASAGGETCGGGLHMVDIRTPLEPTFAGCFSDTSTGRRGTGYTHDAQCVTYEGPDADYAGREVCFGSNETALSIADVTDKENPIAVATASYPNVAYSHQAWLSEDHQYLYMNDELDELSGNVEGTRTLIWDVTDLDDPQLVREFVQELPSSDHNLYIRDNLMYQSNYASGLRIFDISDPVNPVPAGHFDTNPFGTNEAGFNGSWSNYPYFPSGTVVVTSIGEGLFVLKKDRADS